MKHTFWLACLLFALLTVSPKAAEPAYTPATMIVAVNAELDQVADAVVGVKDEATATKAAERLAVIAGNLKKIAAKAEGMPQPDKATSETSLAKLGAKVEEIQTKIEKAKPQIAAAGARAGEILGKGMIAFGASMQEVAVAFQKLDRPPAEK